MKYRFEPAAETMPRGKLAALQLKRLRQTRLDPLRPEVPEAVAALVAADPLMVDG